MKGRHVGFHVLAAAFAVAAGACSSGDDDAGDDTGFTVGQGIGGTGNTVGGSSASASGGSSGRAANAPGSAGSVGGSAGRQSAGGAGKDEPPGAAGMSGAAGMTAMGGAGNPGTPPQPAGPEDGDPSKPIVAIDGLPCGGPQGGFGLGSANHQIDGRDMIVTYPCEKHEGAPVTFILNLHGTTPLNLHFYQHAYFSVHRFASSHNFIVVTPSSVVEQWGNGDDGQDQQHLMKIIEWVYSDFAKFDIRGMWVAGHSWGGAYTARFGCLPELADKVKGLFMQSGGGVGGFGGASCADHVSVLISTAEGDGRMPSDQSALAMSHGCDGAMMETFLMNQHTFWTNCNPGFVHANYYMLGKEHATNMDVETVESAADWIKLSRQ